MRRGSLEHETFFGKPEHARRPSDIKVNLFREKRIGGASERRLFSSPSKYPAPGGLNMRTEKNE